MVTTDVEPVRLRLPVIQRWGRGGAYAGLGAVGVAIGVLGGSEVLANSTSVTTVGKVVFGVVGLVCVLLGLWLVRTGVNIARHRASRLPVLTASATIIKLQRPGRKDRELARDRVAAATFDVRPPQQEGESPLAYLEWWDAEDRSLGTWTLDPAVGPGLARFLAAIGVDQRRDPPEGR